MTHRRRLLMSALTEREPIYLYNNGSVNGHSFKSYFNKAANNESGAAASIGYLNGQVITIRLYIKDRTIQDLCRACAIDSTGIAGNILKRYKTAKATYSISGWLEAFNSLKLYIYENIGTEYNQSVVSSFALPKALGNNEASISLDTLVLDSNKTYHIGLVAQSTTSFSYNASVVAYFDKLWLE